MPALLAIELALGGAACNAQPATSHATRQGQAVRQQEEALLRAMRERGRAQLERLLSDEFEMTVAPEPDRPVDRDLWIDSVVTGPAGSWQIEQLTVRDWGGLAVASFLLRPTAGAARRGPPVFVVDAWRIEDERWRLLSRHAALALGSRKNVPGDAAPRSAPKKY